MKAMTRKIAQSALALLIGASIAACGAGSDVGAGDRLPASSTDRSEPNLSHVHGIGRNPGDGDVRVASHHGLWRIEDGGEPKLVGEHQHDFMGFEVLGEDHFIASGHPSGARSLPPHMGLIESRDGGRSWKSRSLMGDADFHALRHDAGTSYGWNSQDGALMSSRDLRSWRTLQEGMAVLDLAARGEHLLVTSPRSDTEIDLLRSSDRGRTFEPVGDAPQLVRLAWRRDGLTGVDPDGTVWNSIDRGLRWTRAGTIEDMPDALAADGDGLLAAAGGRILESRDAGATWTQLASYE